MADEREEVGTSPELRRAFGAVLQGLRHEKGVSQEKLGMEVGFYRTYVSLLERGLKSPLLGAIFRVARILGVTPGDLIQQGQHRLQADDRRGEFP